MQMIFSASRSKSLVLSANSRSVREAAFSLFSQSLKPRRNKYSILHLFNKSTLHDPERENDLTAIEYPITDVLGLLQ